MDGKIRAGITMRIVKADNYDETRDAISHDWMAFLGNIGFTPVLIPNSLEDPAAYFSAEKCGILILSNGEDVRLGRGPDGKFTGTERDMTEAQLLKYAIDNGVPVLGVCRGMLFINVFLGGKLTGGVSGHVTPSHTVEIMNCYFKSLYGEFSLNTNSYHNTGIEKENLAEGLLPWATSGNMVEGFYHGEYPIMGMLWHPERAGESGAKDMEVIRKFMEKAVTVRRERV
ncbi:MAG: gamma-glutamyl-gamma-aminobutyrate hydrolase family protein [Candidatus Omnitrophota bacterium]